MSKWREAMEAGRRLRVGHRGAAGLAPMNTLRSFQRAIDAGVDAVELDVRWTSDRRLVVIHDDELAQSTNGEGLVHERTLAELRRLDAGQGRAHPDAGRSAGSHQGKGLGRGGPEVAGLRRADCALPSGPRHAGRCPHLFNIMLADGFMNGGGGLSHFFSLSI